MQEKDERPSGRKEDPVPDELPPEALAADPVGEPERTPNASNDEDGPESVSDDVDQDGMPDGTVTAG